MAMTMHVDIVSAEAEIYSGRATMVFAPAVMGEVGILPRRPPLLTKIRPGEVRIRTEGGTEESFSVSGGVLEVPPPVVAKQRAEEALANLQGEFDLALAEAELAEAIAQLKAIQQIRKKSGR